MDCSNRHRLRVEFHGGQVSAIEFDGWQIEPTSPLDRLMNYQEKAVRDLVWAIRQLAETSLEPDRRTIHGASAPSADPNGSGPPSTTRARPGDLID